jgi:hypothetical protein
MMRERKPTAVERRTMGFVVIGRFKVAGRSSWRQSHDDQSPMQGARH